MKKLSILLLITISSSMLLFGCGKENASSGEVVNGADIGLSTGGTATQTATDETASTSGQILSKLTNEPISQELADTRPIAVMYPINKEALPQYGLNKVDIFYEIFKSFNIIKQ